MASSARQLLDAGRSLWGRRASVAAGLLVALGVFSALGVGSASAAAPEFGKCAKVAGVKVGKKTVYSGGYADKHCAQPSASRTGKYEWSPGVGSGIKFSGSGKRARFIEGTGSPTPEMRCGGIRYSGEYTGPSTMTMTITYTGCEYAEFACVAGEPHECPKCEEEVEGEECELWFPCRSTGAADGEVTTPPLEGQLGYIETPPDAIVGIKLTSAPHAFLETDCGFTVGGPALAQVTTLGKTSKNTKLRFSPDLPEEFEGAHAGLTAYLEAPDTSSDEEPIEVRG